MIRLGQWQELKVVRSKDFGIYLGDPEDEGEAILLPRKQVPEGTKAGDRIEVFVYKDSQDRIISTTNRPLITLDEIKLLKVVSVGSIGAFMDWGLEKDILLPFKEQTCKVSEGKEYLVRMYIDKSERLCVSMKLYDYLRKDSPYVDGDYFTGTVYEYKDEMGAFVAVDNQYSGLIAKKELFKNVYVGDKVEGRIVEVREDGKLNLSVRRPAYLQMDDDSELIKKVIESYDGVLPFNDKVSPEVIKKEFGLSKNAFKRAVGRLLKEGQIEITERSIRLIKR